MNIEKIIDNYGNIFWYKPGTNILHREDGPAIEYSNGTKWWYKNGEQHREDGPAVIYSDSYKEYWLNGKKYISYQDWVVNIKPMLKSFI